MKNVVLSLFIGFLALCARNDKDAAFAATKWLLDTDQGKGQVEFTAIGKPKALKIRGNGIKPKGKIFIQIPASAGMTTQISGSFILDLSSLDTGISLRNRHLREKYLEVEKFPKAELKLIKLDQLEKILSGEKTDLDALPFEGLLSLHGVQKAISGKADIKKENQSLDIEATFDLSIKDFSIETPSFAGITVADHVEVYVKLHNPLLIISD